MRLKTNWHSTWTPWVGYRSTVSGQLYMARKRCLYIGSLQIAVLCESTLRSAQPFYMMPPSGGPIHSVRGTTAFRTVRAFMRQLKCAK